LRTRVRSAPRLFAYTSLGGAINGPARRIKMLDDLNQCRHVIIGEPALAIG